MSIRSESAERHDEQLRKINRMVSHDLKNKIGAIVGAAELVREDWISEEERRKFIDIVLQNARSIQGALDDLSELARPEPQFREERARLHG